MTESTPGREPRHRGRGFIDYYRCVLVAPNQTRGLIEVHFPERGKRKREAGGRLSGLSSPGIKLLLQTLRDEESVGDVEGDGILSVAKLKYRTKVCTLDNASARARA